MPCKVTARTMGHYLAPALWQNEAMKKITVSDLHARTGAILEEVLEGSPILIEKHGVAVAQLSPLRRPRRRLSPSEFVRKMQPFWDRMPQVKGDSTQFISEDRER